MRTFRVLIFASVGASVDKRVPPVIRSLRILAVRLEARTHTLTYTRGNPPLRPQLL